MAALLFRCLRILQRKRACTAGTISVQSSTMCGKAKRITSIERAGPRRRTAFQEQWCGAALQKKYSRRQIVLPTSIIGSLPRPKWYDAVLGTKSFLEAMVYSDYREQYEDAVSSFL